MPNRSGIELTIDDLPMWQWARIATPEFFNRIPEIPLENLPPEFGLEVAATEESKAAAEEPKKEKHSFYYAEVKTQYCIDDDLDFCGALAKVYSRILEGKGGKIFLKGNVFLAKLAKATLEKNSDLFAEACEKYADENYFNDCSKTLEQWNFVHNEGKKFSRDSWLDLYKVVLLLTEEYLATKCELPEAEALECKDNSESIKELEIVIANQDSNEYDIEGASLLPIKGMRGLSDSSDNVGVGDSFYDFLSDNFPFKDNQSQLSEFIKGIYGNDIGKSFSPKDATSKNLPRPKFSIDPMESDRFGYYKNNMIYLNQSMVLESLRKENQSDIFRLLIAMLVEYGYFLNDFLLDRMNKPPAKSIGKKGIDFAIGFMEYHEENLLKKYGYKFADLTAPDSSGKEQLFALEISGFSYEQRMNIFSDLKQASDWHWED